MFDKRVINGTAVALVAFFLFLCGVDVVTVDYEVPIGWYGLMGTLVTLMTGTSIGVTLSKRKGVFNYFENEGKEPPNRAESSLRPRVPSESELLLKKLKKVPIEELFPEQTREGD